MFNVGDKVKEVFKTEEGFDYTIITGEIYGNPVLCETGLLWPIKLDEPFWGENRRSYITVLLVHHTSLKSNS